MIDRTLQAFSIKSHIFLLALLSPFFCVEHARGQQYHIQWASRVEYQFNHYHDVYFSGTETLGPPNAFPPGYLSKNALRLKSERSYGTLVLGFQEPQHVQHVVIIESNKPGRLAQVKVKDTEGRYHVIYQKDPEKLSVDFRALVITMPRTEYKVATIELTINAITTPGLYQVDAVGLLDAESLDVIKSELRGANFNIEQEITFTARKELLGSHINSKYTEVKPLVSHDGATLYFSRLFSPDNHGGIDDPQDIYFSKYLNGNWTKAYNIGPPLNDELSNGICSISPDGNTILVINGYDPYGKVEPGVSISRRTVNGWSRPEKLEIEGFENKSKYQDFYLSADQSVLFMAIEMEDSYGDQDIYISKKIGPNRYSKPRNLGKVINTPKAEISPFLAMDNKTLYFASDGHGGYGQSDIFRTTRLDDTWMNWSTPKNMGPSVNTSSWDAYFSITAASDYAYFVSSEGNRSERENIFRIPLSPEMLEDPATNLVSFTGKVENARTGQALSSDILLKATEGPNAYRAVSDKVTGEYTLFVPAGSKHNFTVKAPGYIAYDEEVDLSETGKGEKVVRIIKLTPIEVGQIVTLNNLFFEQGKANILDRSMPTLDRLLELMMENPAMEIELSGHTDRTGSGSANLRLSFERVERIKEYLIQYGIDKKRIQAIGHGGRYPVAPSDTEENRAKNRRVEVKILGIV